MRYTLIISSLLILSSCAMPWSRTPPPAAPIEYATTQSGSPAAAYCTGHEGIVSYEKNPSVPTMDFIYCTTKSGAKIDAWKYLNDNTIKTGTGLPI